METDLKEIQDLTNIITNTTITTATLMQSQLGYLHETASQNVVDYADEWL